MRSCTRTGNPIGVGDEPIASTEYESYVPEVLRALQDEPSVGDLVEMLKRIEVEEMGIDRERDKLRDAAERLLELDV